LTDVLLRQSDNGGEITIVGGLLAMSEGLETAAYLSIFGGNEDDPGQADTSLQWWGNLLDSEPERAYRSETQALLAGGLPAIPANLLRYEQAAARDLKWMLDTGTAQSVAVDATIPGVGKILIGVVIITAAGQRLEFSFG
jgi:phage gp46-like protein